MIQLESFKTEEILSNFSKYLPLPYSNSNYNEIYVLSFNGEVVFNWLNELTKELRKDILNKINRKDNKEIPGKFTRDSLKIYYNETPN